MDYDRALSIAKQITKAEIMQMLNNAKLNVPNWRAESRIRNNYSLGCSWNLWTSAFDLKTKSDKIRQRHALLLDFGDYLPEKIRMKYDVKPYIFHHQEPDLDNV